MEKPFTEVLWSSKRVNLAVAAATCHVTKEKSKKDGAENTIFSPSTHQSTGGSEVGLQYDPATTSHVKEPYPLSQNSIFSTTNSTSTLDLPQAGNLGLSRFIQPPPIQFISDGN